MPNRNAEKIRRRREKSLEDKTLAAESKSKTWQFWILLVVLFSTTASLVYLSFTNNAAGEYIIPIIISIIAFLVVIVWFLPKFYVRSLNESGKDFDREKERLKLEDDTRKTVAQIVGGAVILGSLIFSFNTYHLQQEGQFTDRFTKAVAQIGDNKLEVRLGGLYALERIAKDSPKDHPTVMEILSAYIRENSKKEKSENAEKEESAENNNINKNANNVESVENSNSNKKTNNKVDETKKSAKVATDIQAALTIIGRRKSEQDSKTDRINLSGADLMEADLHKANLSKAILNEAILSGAILSEATLSGATLYYATLNGTILDFSDLSGTHFDHADLNGANLNGANLNGANLFDVNLNETNLNFTDLRYTNLSYVKNLTFERLGGAVINEKTQFPDYLANRRKELLDVSKANFERRQRIVGNLQN